MQEDVMAMKRARIEAKQKLKAEAEAAGQVDKAEQYAKNRKFINIRDGVCIAYLMICRLVLMCYMRILL